jgi:hypothetical protein
MTYAIGCWAEAGSNPRAHGNVSVVLAESASRWSADHKCRARLTTINARQLNSFE